MHLPSQTSKLKNSTLLADFQDKHFSVWSAKIWAQELQELKNLAQDTEKWKPMEIIESTWYSMLPKVLKKRQTTNTVRNCQIPSKLFSCRNLQSESSSSVRDSLLGYGIRRKQYSLENLQLSSSHKSEALKQRLLLLWISSHAWNNHWITCDEKTHLLH